MDNTGFLPVPVKYSVKRPTSTPAMRPMTVAQNTPIAVYRLPYSGSSQAESGSLNHHSVGSMHLMIKKDAMIMMMDETNSPMLSAFCGLPPSFTFTKNVPRNDITMPTPASARGSSTAERPLKLSENPGTINAAPSTIVPMMDPTYD